MVEAILIILAFAGFVGLMVLLFEFKIRGYGE